MEAAAANNMRVAGTCLTLALRDTLRKHGVPSTWITPEARPTVSVGGDRGMHWRLAVREWDARLPAYMVAFQKELAAASSRAVGAAAGSSPSPPAST